MFSVIYSPRFLNHETGSFHPERSDRLRAIVAALQGVSWRDRLHWQEPTAMEKRSPLEFIAKVHSPDHIDRVRNIAASGGGRLDADTPISPESYDVALLAVNGWLDGVDRVLETGDPAFILSRPPGHHAESDRGMGFCLFSNAAIAAIYALERLEVDRVAILDWDVHHGNGTQVCVENNPNIIYCSLHEYPHYPGTGKASERGTHNNVLNFPMLAGSDRDDYLPLFKEKIVPFLRDFNPDLLIVSAGYDANAADPLARIALEPEDFGKFTESCLSVTRRIVFGLEGGYDLDSLSSSVVETIAACL